MNKMTKLFMVALASAVATSSAFAANYSAGQPSSGYPAYADQGQYYDQSPDVGGEHSYMRRADNRFSRMRQDNQNMYLQDHSMSREGYDPNESYYGETNPSYQGQFSRQARQDQPMHRDAGYPQGAYYNAGYDASAPQSYPIDDSTHPNAPRGANFRTQGAYGPRGYGNANQSYPRDGSSRVVKEDGHEIKHEGTDQHPVYEYMLGKDGKWHNVPSQNRNPNWQQSGSYELGYNDDSHHGEKSSPESYALDGNSSTQKDDSDSSSRYSPYGSRGDASSSYNVNNRRTSSTSNWNTEEDNLDQSGFNPGSSSTTKRNAQR